MKGITSILFTLLTAMCLYVFAAPVAANTEPSYEIIVDVSFIGKAGNETIDSGLYMVNCYILSDKTTGQFVVAEYDEVEKSYVVISYSSNRESATPLHCGMNNGSPEILRITGLSEGKYDLSNIQVASGYHLLKDSIEITLTKSEVCVNGEDAATRIDPSTGSIACAFSIQHFAGIELPMSEPNIFRWSYCTFGFDIITPLFYILMIACIIGLIAIMKSDEKDHSKHCEQIDIEEDDFVAEDPPRDA